MGEEIVSLSTIAKRKTANIESKKHPGGKLYEFANRADFGPYEYAILMQRNEELGPLLAKAKAGKKITPAEERKVKKALDDMVKMILPDLEAAVIRDLKMQQKEMLILIWSASIAAEGASAEGEARNRPTTAGSSRASRSSTAATRRHGGTSRSGS